MEGAISHPEKVVAPRERQKKKEQVEETIS